MSVPASEVQAQLAFARPVDVVPDDQPTGLLRACSHDLDAPVDENTFDVRLCKIRDCSSKVGFCPGLVEHGFTHVDLGRRSKLQAVLERVRASADLRDEDIREIRRCLRFASLPLSDGARLRVLFIASEGFFMRRTGPNGMRVNDESGHHHEPARAVHIDQDVDGTPLRQILRGLAPWIFHHDSPAHANRRSPLHVLNLWIPLDQATAPLALLDRNTLDRRAHQLRYGLPTDTFLERTQDRNINDIWTLLHDDRQRWYFTSELDARRAYAFETLSTAHGAFILPGEDVAEALYRQLEAALVAIEARDEAGLRTATADRQADAPPGTTEPLARAIETMRVLVRSAHGDAPTLVREPAAEEWCTAARDAMNRVVRKSIEMRVVGLVLPNVWSRRRQQAVPGDATELS